MKSYNLILMIILKKIKKLNILFLTNIFLLTYLTFDKNVIAQDIDNTPSVNYLNKSSKENFYILGPGDSIYMKVSDKAIDLNHTWTIDGQGYAYLKRLNKIYVSGLTLEELKNLLNKKYSQFVRNPNVELKVQIYRPVRFYIDGEVENPGTHIIEGSSFLPLNMKGSASSEENLKKIYNLDSNLDAIGFYENEKKSLSEPKEALRPLIFPTLIDVIRKSGGILAYSDLEKVQITRINSQSNGGGRIKTEVNLMDTLNLQNNQNNMRILDGDNIFIPKSSLSIPENITKANRSNINPKFINIYITGAIQLPGSFKVSKRTALMDAVMLAGSKKILSGRIQLLRLNKDGVFVKKSFSFSKKARKGGEQNPFLIEGDMVFVQEGALRQTSEAISVITNPLQGIYSTFRLIDLISDL